MSWMFGDEVLEGETSEREDEKTGSFTVTSELVVVLDTEHTGAPLTCMYVEYYYLNLRKLSF